MPPAPFSENREMLPPEANRPLPLSRSRPVTQSSFGEAPIPIPVPPPLAPATAAGGPAGLAAAPTVTGLLAALRRRLLLALAVATAGLALAIGAVCLFVPAKYVAQTQVKLVSRQREPIIGAGFKNFDDPTIWKANQEGILKSPLVLDNALRGARTKGLPAPYTVGGLTTALKVDFLVGPEIMRVTFTGDDADSVAVVLNEVVGSYLEQVRQEELSNREEIFKELEKTERDFRTKLWKLEAALKDVEKKENYDPERAKLDHQLAFDRLKDADKEFQLLKLEHARKQRDLWSVQARVKNIADEPLPQEELNKVFGESPSVQGYIKDLDQIHQEITVIKARTRTELHEKMLRGPLALKKQTETQLAKLLKELHPDAEARVRLKLLETLKADATRLQVEVKGLEQQKNALAANLKRLQDETSKADPANLPRTTQMNKLRNDIAQTNEALTNVNKEIAKLRVEPLAQLRAVVLQRAAPPDSPDYSRRIKFGGAAGLGVFGLLLFGVAGWEFRSRRINSADEVAQGLGLNVLGALPALPSRLRRPVPGNASARDLHLQHQMTEAVDAIRTLLLHQTRVGALQVVMITSPGGGEGKTSLASQLAASLARAWRKTLLVDGDLRNPAAHKLFDVPLEPGLSEVLRDEVKIGDVVRPTPLGRLWMVPAGNWDSHAVQALAQEGVRALFAQLKSEYEFIIVDSCPVLPVADALLLAQNVDAVIFSVLRDVSRLPAVHAAHQRLSALGVRTLGAVMIGVGGDVPALAYQYPAQTA
jgi:capsular exopolysaccharide synthesis family protein